MRRLPIVSRSLWITGFILFACGLGASVSNPGRRDTEQLCNAYKTSLALKAGSEEAGLRVGQRAPSFKLKDQNEKEISLQSLVEKGAVVLVFYRSADWCPYCKQQLVDLERNRKEIEAAGSQLVGISYDSVFILKRFSNKRISFPLLSDTGSKTIDAYNIRDMNVNDGVARHAIFIIDQKGMIRAKLYQVSYAERPAVDALIKAIKDSH
jgi:peroxiredoxin